MPEVNEMAVAMLRETLARAQAGEVGEVTIIATLPDQGGASAEVVSSWVDPLRVISDGTQAVNAGRVCSMAGSMSRAAGTQARVIIPFESRHVDILRWIPR